MEDTRTCSSCGETKPIDQFQLLHAAKRKNPWRRKQCKPCFRASQQSYREGARERLREASREYYRSNRELHQAGMKRRRIRIRMRALEHYSQGEPECTCCGETVLVFLCLDHIGNDGAAHRKSMSGSIYAWLHKTGYPPGYQVLCWNCNSARHILGICPHQSLQEQIVNGQLAPAGDHPSLITADAGVGAIDG